MIRLCVFDMDGTLLDTERELYVAAGLKASAELGRPVTVDFLARQMGGSFVDYKVHMKEDYGQDYPVEEYFEIYWKTIESILRNEKISLRPGVKEILDYCKKQGIEMAVGTSTSEDLGRDCLKRSGIYDYFDFILFGNQVKKRKPDPEMYLTIVDHFGYDKDEVLIFEDGHNGVQAAINGGLRYVAVKDIAYLSIEDIEKSDLCIEDISLAIDLLRKENETAAGV